jgi:hypothetical protein
MYREKHQQQCGKEDADEVVPSVLMMLCPMVNFKISMVAVIEKKAKKIV